MKNPTLREIIKDLSRPEPMKSICGLVVGGAASGKTTLFRKLHLDWPGTEPSAFVREGADPKLGAKALGQVKVRPMLVTLDHVNVRLKEDAQDENGKLLNCNEATHGLIRKSVVRAPDVSFWAGTYIPRVLNDMAAEIGDEEFVKRSQDCVEYKPFDVVLFTRRTAANANVEVLVLVDRVKGTLAGRKFLLDPAEVKDAWKKLIGITRPLLPPCIILGKVDNDEQAPPDKSE